jgi:hypothetical protein
MSDWCEAEQARLLKRTAEPGERTDVFALDRHPYIQQEHDELREQIAQHQRDLIVFRECCLGAREDGQAER